MRRGYGKVVEKEGWVLNDEKLRFCKEDLLLRYDLLGRLCSKLYWKHNQIICNPRL